ncbi:twin-arginine translocase TatA/TatE family subunit [Aliifodinibius salicampi]|uniref:Sec-independent protein translocase protein TatA n=1 Tax=Fodinibius salicampi TaxID=1920655 RepID=A0ABT3PVB7_9BACT|nr:twin-arginine translocase TatA/TatE family subunit [Fodinibius salicampi]MCW9711804.1 twin-arginine translocase TatA/TatE family subunit [Fodinibius salicampi]
MGSFGGMEILIVLMVILLFFGAKRIPELARGIGQGMNEFRKASDQIKQELEQGEKEGLGSEATKNKSKEEAKAQKSQD